MPRLKSCLLLLSVVLLLVFSSVPLVQNQEVNGGNITFQPNIISDLVIIDRPEDKPESFRFEWLGNKFDIELFFNATYFKQGEPITKLFSLKDFEDDFNVSVNYAVNKTNNQVQFGWVIDDVENISDYVHNAWFIIEDTQPFDYDEIELENMEIPEEPFNVTLFHLPDNLVLSFEDLHHKGFVIGSQNKTSTNVKGFRGKSSWNLDPILYSSDIITVTGASTTLHEDLWDADKAGTFSLQDRDVIVGTDKNPVSVTNALRPTDYTELGGVYNDLNITIENWSEMASADIEVIGTDREGNSVSENVTVTGNGNYSLAEKYATVTSTEIVTFTDDITWDLLIQPWDNLTDWTKLGSATSEINPAGQLHQDGWAGRYRDIGELPTQYTFESRINITDFTGQSWEWKLRNGEQWIEVAIHETYLRATDPNSWPSAQTNSHSFNENQWYVIRFTVDTTTEEIRPVIDGVYEDAPFTYMTGYTTQDGYVDSEANLNTDGREDYLNITSGLVGFDYELIQGQWGVIWKTGTQSYKIDDTQINIGNNTAAGASVTDVSDVSVNVLFETSQRWGYYVQRANLTFGRQDSGYATSAGVDINWNSSYGMYGGSGVIIGTTASDSRLWLYSSTIRSTYSDDPDQYPTGIPYFSGSVTNVVIYNCIFEKVGMSSIMVDIYNLGMFRGIRGFSNTRGTLEQVYLYDQKYAISFSTYPMEMKNVHIIATDSDTGLRDVTGATAPDQHFINVEWTGLTYWKFYWHYAPYSMVYRDYEFDLTMYFTNGSQAQNANVTISNAISGTSDSWLTFANGSIPPQIYSMGFYNQSTGDTLNDYNPYNLTVTLDGYETYTTLLNITQKEDLSIALTPTPQPSPDTVLAVAGFSFIMFTVAAAIFIIKRKKESSFEEEPPLHAYMHPKNAT